MFVRRLRTKIAVNLAVLLLLAMVLIDLVSMVTVRRELIRAEISKANLLLNLLENDLPNTSDGAFETIGLGSGARWGKMIKDSHLANALLIGAGGEKIYLGEPSEIAENELVAYTRQALSSGIKANHFFGSTWGIFWKQKAELILSAPLVNNKSIVGAVSIVLPLEGVYNALRHSQQIIFIYIAINLAILAYVGIYRISKLYLLPLGRLAKRAEDYKEDDEIIFSVRKEDNELNRLSKALNIMLKRISADKEKLRSTVLSLEKANLELKKAQKEIIQAEKLASVGRLSAGIAHEIGNPIGIVIGYLDLLKQEDITGKERDEYIHRTEAEIERINTIIRQLLEVSRPSSSDRAAVSVHELIDDTAGVLRVQPFMSNIEFSLQLGAEDDTVLGDSNQLRQVFLNLIINAADAISVEGGDTGGQVEIITALETEAMSDTTNRAARLNILFIDSGPGIDEENLGNIFDPFFTTKEPGRGTGLGLSVSFMIVESMGGTMTVTSAAGNGTTMKISLPIHRASDINE
jgi:two-component system, NtrC family, sensor kinase